VDFVVVTLYTVLLFITVLYIARMVKRYISRKTKVDVTEGRADEERACNAQWVDPNIVRRETRDCRSCGRTDVRPCPAREECHQIRYDHEGWPQLERYIYWTHNATYEKVKEDE
jgi:hypothetical protein